MRTHARSHRTLAGAALTLAASLAGTLADARTASAQQLEQPRSRQGYYLGLGLGGGADGIWEKGESLGGFAGNAFALHLGQLVSGRWGLGLALGAGGGQNKDKVTATSGGLAIEASLLVWDTLAVRAQSGFAFLSIADDQNPDDKKRSRGTYGAAYGLGASWDLFPWKRLSGGLALTPTLQARFLPSGNFKVLTLLVGLDVLWFTGLPRNQLVLPDNEAYKK
jgi:hypothetical protein